MADVGSASQTRLLLLEHDDICVPGYLHAWADMRGVALVEARADRGIVPEPREFDGVVVLGSVDSVYDPAIQPWFQTEVTAIQRAVRASTPVLGICFGAQTLAAALGGNVQRARQEEIGWKRIVSRSPEAVPEGPWFQWHGDGFTLPEGATLLADNPAGNQAFAYREHLGVQFHPEVDLAVLRVWIDQGRAELERLGIEPELLWKQSRTLAPEARVRAFALFDRFLQRVRQPSNTAGRRP